MSITEYSEKYRNLWNDYVVKNCYATFAHQIEWKDILEKSFRQKPLYLLSSENDQITGILPLFYYSSILFGKFLVSLPWLDYGGVCAGSVEIQQKLIEEAIQIAKQKKCKFLELRSVIQEDVRLVTKTNKITFKLELYPDPEKAWQGIDSKARNQIRKAQKSGLEVSFGGEENIDMFYSVFSTNMRDLGTPVWTKELFKNILAYFPEKSEIALVKMKDKTIGGALILYFKDMMTVPSASSLSSFLRYCPNNILYWEIIKRGCIKKLKIFDLGRSSWESGTFNFKKQWVEKPTQLYWQYYLNKIKKLPDLNPESSKFSLSIKLWKKLPLAWANFLGPKIVRKLP
ncbi:MAG: FemAB family PEP-CTERM system-associated protein [candidate division Zixibacteria bacterium]|nr:FemAB family PEP-CTERM system-associated protein [candidate division Zixibacteria bacterium]